jgi:hypothetical protein
MQTNTFITAGLLLITTACYSQVLSEKKNNNAQPLKVTRPLNQVSEKAVLPPRTITPAANLAILSNASAIFTTGNDPKASTTNYTLGLFDANGDLIVSLVASNVGPYFSGNTLPITMRVDSATTIGTLVKGGHMHLAMAAGGFDTWQISQIKIIVSFTNPRVEKTIIFPAIRLSPANLAVDLNFTYDGNNFISQ